MKLARPLFLVLAAMLLSVAVPGKAVAAPGKALKADIAFTTIDLFAANATSRKCVKLGKAAFVHQVVCNCYTGTADITVLDAEVSVFPTATATQQAAPLGIATGCTTTVIIGVDTSFVSETTAQDEICIQATAVGTEAAVNCKIRATSMSHGKP